MTQTIEKPEALVLVECVGIISLAGFTMSPDGMAPDYVQFMPGVPTAMKKEYADYLVSQDNQKFLIVKPKKEAPVETEEEKKKREEAEAAKAAKKKDREEKAAARKAAKEAAKAAKK